MRIRVLFFGVLRDLTGQRECDVELADGVTAKGLFDHFAAQFPALEAARKSVTVARNQEFADPSVKSTMTRMPDCWFGATVRSSSQPR